MSGDRADIIAIRRDLLAEQSATETTGDAIPEIVIGTDEHRVIDEAIAALSKCDDIYQRGGMLVHVLADESPLRGIARAGSTPRITPLPLPRLRELLSQHGRWCKAVTTTTGVVHKPAHVPDWATRAVAARGTWPGIRVLEAVVEAPVMRPDGTVLDTPGYDEATGLLFSPSIDFARIARYPEPGWNTPRRAAHAPDGRTLTYLASESGDDAMSLFAFDRTTGKSEVLLRAEDLGSASTPRSREEELRRERRSRRRHAHRLEVVLHDDRSIRIVGRHRALANRERGVDE